NIVNTLRPSNFEEQILLSTELIEKAIKELVISTKCLLQEKENVDQYQKIYYDYNRRASASSEASLVNSSASSNDTNNFLLSASVNVASINNNTSINNTASLTRNRRAMSMDVPDTEYPDFEENGQARNRTFSQRSLPKFFSFCSPIQPPPLYYDQNGVQVEIDQFSERKTSAKLMQLLGSEVTNAPPKKKWYLEYDYDVKGGTFEALVERLTCHDSFDANFTNTFLLTYRSFCTTIQFMSELLKRYLLPQPAGLTDINEVNEWHEKKLKPIRLRNKNFSTYREQLHSVNPPCVPFLGVYLTDLTFIDDGNSNNLKNADGEVNEKLINFSKRSKTADVIREIQQYQNQVYCLQDVPELQNWLKESLVRIGG
ncbi:ras GEF, partial [Piromyces finnis]